MTVRILRGDVRDRLRDLPDESVHCVVTSPPYWGLRDYGIAGQIGLEDTLQDHFDALIEVFREVRRVLRKDGTCWVNYGDAYAGSWGAQSRGEEPGELSSLSGGQVYAAPKGTHTGSMKRTPGLKPKDRMLLPARLALALQADGWWLRDEIVWHKPNPMPSSVKDRTTPAHEMIYLLSRSARYFYDADAIKEPMADSSVARLTQPSIEDQTGGAKAEAYEANGLNARTGSRKPNEIVQGLARRGKNEDSPDRRRAGFNERWDASEAHARLNNQAEKKIASEKWGARHEGWQAVKDSLGGRNKRSVWTIPSEPLPEAHFATFPTRLIEPCILAGCPVGGTVLDPFGGAGTTGLVADRLQRDAILIEINPEYADMAERRIRGDAPLFAQVGS